jgi:hypothetical protein
VHFDLLWHDNPRYDSLKNQGMEKLGKFEAVIVGNQR